MRICIGDIRVDRVEIENNYKYNNITYVAGEAPNPQTVVLNFYSQLFTDMLNIKVYIAINMPEDANDRKYRKEIIRTVIDAEKFFRRAQTNVVVRYFTDRILQYVNFKLEFPLKKVSICIL